MAFAGIEKMACVIDTSLVLSLYELIAFASLVFPKDPMISWDMSAAQICRQMKVGSSTSPWANSMVQRMRVPG